MSRWLAYGIYVLVLALLRWQWDVTLVFLVVGVFMGWGMIYVDRLIQAFLVRPHEHLSEYVKHKLREHQFWEVVQLLRERGDEQRRLVMRSVIFMAAWIPVAIFVLTSTGSMLAVGLVMGMGLYLLVEVWRDWSNWERLREWLFWPISRRVSEREIKGVVLVYTLAFVGLSLGLV
jgi:hypothetical protein